MSNDYFQKAMEFIEYSKKTTNLDDLGAMFHEVIREFGFEYYACVSSVDFGEMPEGAVFLANYPDDWASYYIENNLERRDPIARASLKRHLPFNWGNDIVTRGLRPSQIEVMSEAEEAGLFYGVTVPIHIVGALPGSVTVAGSSSDIAPEAEHAVHLMGVYLHDAALRVTTHRQNQLSPIARLTPREIECLQWAAAGKTDWEISSILSIAERTAHTHIEQAKKKLGVHTRVQAVVKAFLTNIIHV